MDLRCDGIFDCEDGTDEEDCNCHDSLKTVFSKLICDGHVDCADSTDEMGCREFDVILFGSSVLFKIFSVTCNETQFACPHSKKCIDHSLHCDGKVDCKFKEDELECCELNKIVKT